MKEKKKISKLMNIPKKQKQKEVAKYYFYLQIYTLGSLSQYLAERCPGL
jgi:hypothetical protein